MGEIADMVLEGDLCQICGVYMENGDGYPQTCKGCSREEQPKPKKKKKKK